MRPATSSSRRRSTRLGDMGINLVPMLDALITIIAFLLYSMSLLAIVGLDSPVPITNRDINKEQLQEKPLQLSLTVKSEQVEIWSPFGKIKTQIIPNLPDGQVDVEKVHSGLVAIKEKFPEEDQLVLVPERDTSYDTLVGLMDASRTLEAGDPPIFVYDKKSRTQRATERLFPVIVFGNLLGET